MMTHRHMLPRRTRQQLAALLAAVFLLSAATSANAQTFRTFTFRSFGPQVIAVPTVYHVPRYRVARNFRGLEYWSVKMRSTNGVFTRAYRVDNSAQAIQLARRDYPNTWIVGASKSYR